MIPATTKIKFYDLNHLQQSPSEKNRKEVWLKVAEEIISGYGRDQKEEEIELFMDYDELSSSTVQLRYSALDGFKQFGLIKNYRTDERTETESSLKNEVPKPTMYEFEQNQAVLDEYKEKMKRLDGLELTGYNRTIYFAVIKKSDVNIVGLEQFLGKDKKQPPIKDIFAGNEVIEGNKDKRMAEQKTINKITFCKTDNDLKVILNDDCLNCVDINLAGNNYWGLFFKLVAGEQLEFKKGLYDYFNSNKKNKLYSNTHFPLQKVLKRKNGCLEFNVKTEIISVTAFKRRLQKT